MLTGILRGAEVALRRGYSRPLPNSIALIRKIKEQARAVSVQREPEKSEESRTIH